MSITLFGTTKPTAAGDPALITQENAIRSWSLVDNAEVLLIGDDTGAAEMADRVGVRLVPNVERSPAGVPLLGDLFKTAQAHSSSDVCLFSNADIIFTDDLSPAADALSSFSGPFLAVGQRWDIDINEPIDFDNPTWGAELRRRVDSEGRQDAPTWIDWFAFPTGQFPDLPPFVIGRPGYDHWMIANALQQNIPVIDLSAVVVAVHQHHEYRGGRDALWSNPDSQRNAALIGPRKNRRVISNATHMMVEGGRVVPAKGLKYRVGDLHAAMGPLLEKTSRIRHAVGVDADALERVRQWAFRH